MFDLVVIVMGYVWFDEEEVIWMYFFSLWLGLMEVKVDVCNVGIMGIFLSGLDAVMVVVI